jgi:hypothetical protein
MFYKKQRYVEKNLKEAVIHFLDHSACEEPVRRVDLNIVPLEPDMSLLSPPEQIQFFHQAVVAHRTYVIALLDLLSKYRAEIDFRVYRERRRNELCVDILATFEEEMIIIGILGEDASNVRKVEDRSYSYMTLNGEDDWNVACLEELLKTYHPTKFMSEAVPGY